MHQRQAFSWTQVSSPPHCAGCYSPTTGPRPCGPHLSPVGGAGNKQEHLPNRKTPAMGSCSSDKRQEWNGWEMSSPPVCTRMPSNLSILGVPDLSFQWKETQLKPSEKQAVMDVWLRLHSHLKVQRLRENLFPGSAKWLLAGFSPSQAVGQRTPSVPCHVGLSVGQLPTWELASFRVNKQEREAG